MSNDKSSSCFNFLFSLQNIVYKLDNNNDAVNTDDSSLHATNDYSIDINRCSSSSSSLGPQNLMLSLYVNANLICIRWRHRKSIDNRQGDKKGNNYTTMAFTASLKRLLIGLLFVMALCLMILYLNESQSILKPASSFFISNYESKHNKIKLVAVVEENVRM